MRRVIKITEAQLRETEGDAFKYLDANDDSHPFNGQSTITAQGKIDGETNGEPIFADRISKQRTPQSWARYRMYGSINMQPHADAKSIDINDVDEGVSIASKDTYTNTSSGDYDNTDKNGDKINDFDQDVANMGQGEGMETLSNGDPMDNLSVIPNGVDRQANLLINMVNRYNLSPKQIAMVLDKIQEAFPSVAQNSEEVKNVLRQQIDPNSIKDFD